MIKIRDLPAEIVAQKVERRRDKPKARISILSRVSVECYIYRCVLFSMLPNRSVGKPNFGRDLHNLIMSIEKQHRKKNRLLYQKSINNAHA